MWAAWVLLQSTLIPVALTWDVNDWPCHGGAVVRLSPLLDSSDMGPGDWINIAQRIAASYSKVDGFVVIMGTDTMAYASSAISFLLENLAKPVIFTGSVLPLSCVINVRLKA